MNDDNESALGALRTSAALVAALAVVQTLMGLMVATSGDGLQGIHGVIGFVTCAAAIMAAITAIVWNNASGNTGLMMHAIAVALMTMVQVGLGEAGAETVHIVLGVLTLIAAVALVSLAYRKPGTAAA